MLWSVHTVFVTLPLTVNKTLKQLSLLPIQCRSHSGGDSVVLWIVSLFPPLPGIPVPTSTSLETTRREASLTKPNRLQERKKRKKVSLIKDNPRKGTHWPLNVTIHKSCKVWVELIRMASRHWVLHVASYDGIWATKSKWSAQKHSREMGMHACVLAAAHRHLRLWSTLDRSYMSAWWMNNCYGKPQTVVSQSKDWSCHVVYRLALFTDGEVTAFVLSPQLWQSNDDNITA